MTAPEIITAGHLLHAYARGLFPMAEARLGSKIHWIDPRRRGIFELANFHVSRSLARAINRTGYTVGINTDFAAVLAACADREETWINSEIAALYLELHGSGLAHSLEIYRDGALVGGVYGVAIAGAFFGESMFSRHTDASKIALAYLIHRLRAGGFALFDTQFLTPHLASLGATEISRADYHSRLAKALLLPATFTPPGYHPLPSSVAGSSAAGSTSGSTRSGTSQRSTHTS